MGLLSHLFHWIDVIDSYNTWLGIKRDQVIGNLALLWNQSFFKVRVATVLLTKAKWLILIKWKNTTFSWATIRLVRFFLVYILCFHSRELVDKDFFLLDDSITQVRFYGGSGFFSNFLFTFKIAVELPSLIWSLSAPALWSWPGVFRPNILFFTLLSIHSNKISLGFRTKEITVISYIAWSRKLSCLPSPQSMRSLGVNLL